MSLIAAVPAADPSQRFVFAGPGGRLVYDQDSRGNCMPDFSFAGFDGEIPNPAATVIVPLGASIDQAIAHVEKMPLDAGGIRGVILLQKGRHVTEKPIRIRRSGVILRGEGPDTVIVARGHDRRSVIHVAGTDDRRLGPAIPVSSDDVPCGSRSLVLVSAAGLNVGDSLVVEHPSSREWIAALGMDKFPSRDRGSYLDWKPGTLNVTWDRYIKRIDGSTVTLNAPITMALDRTLAQATVRVQSWPGRIERVGIENLTIESEFDRSNPRDEQHAWNGVTIERAQNVWVRHVSFRHLAGSAVAIWETVSRVTVADCDSRDPVSELGGERRQTYFTSGTQSLFLRCRADGGRHDFATGHLAAGPIAFVSCSALNAHAFSGPIGSWATGVLYDNVTIDGGGLALTNRETDGQGVGWAAANSVLWQCTAPVITCRMPPTAQNWAIGVWGQFVGNGHWRQLNEFVKPDSLYEAQLRERIGERATERLQKTKITTDRGSGIALDVRNDAVSASAQASPPMSIRNGRILTGQHLLTGSRVGTVWWRGSTLPSRAAELGIGVTRFVPGRIGEGFTDNLDQLAERMVVQNQAVLDHHWGLWYDRRRDDHQMVRRIDGEVWAPFYEFPWARSGRGTAWDGLSKYDLTKFNPWYFDRLREFARHAERNGRVLVQQMYFQHNILEAGAHWADFPWRPANCLQETGFPELPEYVGGKRIYMAEAFYDVTHPVRRELHRAYIHHCLDVLGDCPNVIFQTGEEYSGPLSFVQFWLDCIDEWQTKHNRKITIGLSVPKEIQDAILADPKRSSLISVIDIKYWWTTADGSRYEPKSAQNLAPRQQLREWKGNKSRSDLSIARDVSDLREMFPEKAVTVSLDGAGGWAVAVAGGSIPNLPQTTDPTIRNALPRMTTSTTLEKAFILAEPGRHYLALVAPAGSIALDLPGAGSTYSVSMIDPDTGRLTPHGKPVNGGQTVTLGERKDRLSLYWITLRDSGRVGRN